MARNLHTNSETVASPAATGQAVGAFEQNVDALFLSLLLVNSPYSSLAGQFTAFALFGSFHLARLNPVLGGIHTQ